MSKEHKKKSKKSKETEETVADNESLKEHKKKAKELTVEEESQHVESDKKKKKKHKKDKKRKREEKSEKEIPGTEKPGPERGEQRDEAMCEGNDKDPGDDKPKTSTKDTSSSKEKRQQRKAERQRLMELVPQRDEHGIAYTKQQIRRMRKRAARGLPPLETEEEIRERQREEAHLRKEEEAELQGMIYQKDGTTKHEDDVDEEQAESDEERDDEGGNIIEEETGAEGPEKDPSTTATNGGGAKNNDTQETEQKGSPRKKTRRNKPVPADYVCQACKNKETPPLHWIYDCPLKVTIPGCNHKTTKNHVHEPSDEKVFVSGLPFDAKAKDVRQLFSACGNIRHIKLLTFEDTGRCKGNAFLTFESKEAAMEALKLSGSPINTNNDDEANSKDDKKRKTLTLKVSKLLNRTLTKKKGGKPPVKK